MNLEKIRRFAKLKWPLRILIIFALLLIVAWYPIFVYVTIRSSTYGRIQSIIYSDTITLIEETLSDPAQEIAENWSTFQRDGLCFAFGGDFKIKEYFESKYYVASEDNQTTFSVDYRHIVPQVETSQSQLANMDTLIEHYGENVALQFEAILQSYKYEEPSYLEIMSRSKKRIYYDLVMALQKQLMPTLIDGEKVVHIYRGEDRNALLCPAGDDYYVYVIWLEDHDAVFQGWMMHRGDNALATFQSILNSARICGDFDVTDVTDVEYPGNPAVASTVENYLRERDKL